jgi:hypothetical protein
MALYPTKMEFFAQGIIRSCPIPLDDPDCPICKDPLEPSQSFPQSAVSTSDEDESHGSNDEDWDDEQSEEDHSATQMRCCNNTFGHNCLLIWLSTSNTCPFCRATLFSGPTPLSIQRAEERRLEIEEVEEFMEQWPAQQEELAVQWQEFITSPLWEDEETRRIVQEADEWNGNIGAAYQSFVRMEVIRGSGYLFEPGVYSEEPEAWSEHLDRLLLILKAESRPMSGQQLEAMGYFD